MSDYDAIVLAGGAGRRLGGVDKPGLVVGGRSLLDTALLACADAGTTVVVGPSRRVARPVRWTREAPPGAGPLAALAAGLTEVNRARSELPEIPGSSHRRAVVVLAADLPHVTPTAVRAVLDALEARRSAGARAAALADDQGVLQPLAAAYDAGALASALGGEQPLADRPVRWLLDELAAVPVHGPREATDIDTPGDLARVREGLAEMDEWVQELAQALEVDPADMDVGALLDVARDAAHEVERPAAPVTTFLVGYAAGRKGGGPEAVADAVRVTTELVREWADRAGGSPGQASSR